jgi:hypothetical protein
VSDEPEDRPRTQGEIERTTALAKVEMGQRGVMISAMDSLKEFAETAVKAGVAPKGMGVGAAMMAIQAGLERGMAPLGGLQAAVVINGVLSWRGWAAMAMMRQSGLVVPGTLRTWVEGDLEGPKADAVGFASAQRIGYKEPFVRKFSVADARKAGLWNKSGPWQTRSGNMLEWRAAGDLVRFHFPEVMGGIPIAEDVEAGGVGNIEVTVEGPQERAKRPAPVVSDPLLSQLDGPGDQSGIIDGSVPEGREGPGVIGPPADSAGGKTALPKAPYPFPQPEVHMEGDDRGWEGGPGDLPPEERRAAERRSQEPPHPNLAGAVIEKREADRRSDGLVSVMNHSEEVEKMGKATPCPRCGEQDSGFALFGECGICNYPEAEPGG